MAFKLTFKYFVEQPGNAGPMIIEATSRGVAVEYFLAVHGLLSYDPAEMRCEKVDYATEFMVSKLIPEMHNKKLILELNKQHWQVWRKEK